MLRFKTCKGLLVSSCLMLTASAEPQTREEPGPTVAVQDKRANSNPVIHWNRIANEVFPVDVGPVLDSRAMAILHAAIHDAVNGIERRYEPYTVALSSPMTSAAAAEVLTTHLGESVPFAVTSVTLPGVPRRFGSFAQAAREAGMSRVFGGIHFVHAVEDGWAAGERVGRDAGRKLPRHQQ